MFRDPRYKKYIGSFTFLLLLLFFFIASRVLGNQNLFGFEYGKNWMELLSFNTQLPLRFSGVTFLSSYFIHLNTIHFAQNFLFYGFFSMMVESFMGSLRTVVLPLFVHVISLIILSGLVGGEDLFLGASLGGIALFLFYVIHYKKWFLLAVGVFVFVGYPFFMQSSDLYSVKAHGVALIVSLLVFIVAKKFFPWPKKL